MPAYHTGVVSVWYSPLGTSGWINDQAVAKLLGQPQDVAGAAVTYCASAHKPTNFCVNDTEMALYYNELWPIIGTYQPLNPFKDVLYIKIDMFEWLCETDPIMTTYVSHYVKYITYGIPIFEE